MRPSIGVCVALVLGISPAVLAQMVDPKIHKLCVEAKDYAGCVRAMRGETSSPTPQGNAKGPDTSEGNQCPVGFAYIGGGNCQQVYCQYPATDMGHNQIIAGKPGWGCKYHWWQGAGELRLGAVGKVSFNPKCPPGEPPIGYNSTCDAENKTEPKPVEAQPPTR